MDFAPLMEIAIEEASQSGQDVPVGAVIMNHEGEIIARAHNTKEVDHDPSAHAEIVAIRQATAALKTWRLDGCTLVVTLEPCVMCAGAIVAARIPKVVFGTWDDRVGAAGSLYDLLRDARLGPPAEVISGVLEEKCAAQLSQFFAATRSKSGSK